MEWIKGDYLISTNKQKIDTDYVHAFLATSYWAEDIPKEIVIRSIAGSLSFGIYLQHRQIGFARVISDFATFAYLADVFVDESERGKGLAKWLMQIIMEYPELQGLRRFMLGTRDAHELYRQFGFTPLTFAERWMQKHQPGLYKKE